MIERLESRRLLSASPQGLVPAELPGAVAAVTGRGSLYIQGTTGNDVISIVSDDDGVIHVTFNGQEGSFSGIQRVHVEGAAGNDRITFNSSMNIPATLLGGSGDDRIDARGRRVTLVGGAGNDDLIGRGPHGMHFIGGAGNDRFMGTAGHDTIWGGAGDDIADRSPGTDLLDSVERRLRLDL